MSFTSGLFLLAWASVTHAGTTQNVHPDKAYRFVSPVSLTPEGNFQFCVPSGDRLDRVFVRLGTTPVVTKERKRGFAENRFDYALSVTELLSVGLNTVECPSPYTELYDAMVEQLVCYTNTADTCSTAHLEPPPRLVLNWHGVSVGTTGNSTVVDHLVALLNPMFQDLPYAQTTKGPVDNSGAVTSWLVSAPALLACVLCALHTAWITDY